MKVWNVHEREVASPASGVGRLLDDLGSDRDRLWPRHAWPAIRFDAALGVGAQGGHGPIRYTVEAYDPGRLVRFRFTAPPGFNGYHSFEVEPTGPEHAHLRHVLEMRVSGLALFTWPVIFRPLHDALVEDALDRATTELGTAPRPRQWSVWVKTLRWILSRPPFRNRGRALRPDRR